MDDFLWCRKVYVYNSLIVRQEDVLNVLALIRGFSTETARLDDSMPAIQKYGR